MEVLTAKIMLQYQNESDFIYQRRLYESGVNMDKEINGQFEVEEYIWQGEAEKDQKVRHDIR